jgi:hypothetical protein
MPRPRKGGRERFIEITDSEIVIGISADSEPTAAPLTGLQGERSDSANGIRTIALIVTVVGSEAKGFLTVLAVLNDGRALLAHMQGDAKMVRIPFP